MKKLKEVIINERKFNVAELTVGQIIEVAQDSTVFNSLANLSPESGNSISISFQFISKELSSVMGKCCDFKLEDLKELTPSEIKQLLQAFQEVNSDFLELLGEVGIITALKKIQTKVVNDFSNLLAV